MPKAMSFVALVTCFKQDESIDYDAVRKQARRQAAAGNNILACGANGDFTSLLYEEKLKVCETIVNEVGGTVKVFANTGCPSTYETIRLSKDVISLGVDALSVIAPYFIACTQEGLFNHYSRIADAATRPVYMYDIPARAQNHIETETAMRLADHGNILGIKDSGGKQETLDAYIGIAKAGKNFTVFAGPDSLIRYALTQGAGGCVSGLANVAPDIVAGICREYATGNAASVVIIIEASTETLWHVTFAANILMFAYCWAVRKNRKAKDPAAGAKAA